MKGQEKLDSAYLIFYRNHNDWDSVKGAPILQKLLKIAEEDGNKAEEIFFLNEMAFWYAYGRKMGAKHHKAIKISEEALAKAEKSELPYWVAYTHNQLANLYNTISETEQAVEHYWEARLLFREIGYAKSPWMKEFLFDWAKFNLMQSYQPDTVLYYLRISDQYTCLNPRKNIEAPSLIALVHENYGATKEIQDSSAFYFAKALELAKSYKDTAWIGILYGNLGFFYQRMKQKELALEYYQKNLELINKETDIQDYLWTKVCIVDLYLNPDEVATAYKLIQEVETVNNALKEPIYIPNLYAYKSKALYFMGDFKGAYLALFKENDLAKAHGNSRKIVASADAKVALYQKIYLKEKALFEQNKENGILARNSIIALLFSFLIIAIILYNRRQIRNKAEKELFEQKNLLALSEQKRIADELKAEKELLEQKALLAASEQKRIKAELENAQMQLATYLENLLQKNEIIEKASTELEKFQQINEKQIENISLQELYNARLSTEEDWVKFKVLFDKVYPHFLDGLRSKVKDITPSDLRIIALTKLNIRGKEMAIMLGISYDSVRKAKYRLKKKLEQFEYLDLKNLFENVDN